MRLLFPLAALLLAAAPLAPGASAQSADKIVAQSIAALGGDKALAGLASLELHGQATDAATGQVAAFTLVTRAPNQIYIELAGSQFGWSEAFNGKSAWRRDPDSAPHTLTGSDALQLKTTALFFNTHARGFKSQKWTATYGGHQTLDGQPVEVVTLATELTDLAGAQRQFFFDAASHLPVEIRQVGPGADGAIQFGDYHPVAGVEQPGHLVWRQGAQTLDIAISETLPNAALDERMFDFPSPAPVDHPDAASLVALLRRNQAQLDQIRRNYTCMLTETEQRLDGNGKLKTSTEDGYEVFYLGRQEYRKHVSSQGLPLSPEEQKKEDQRQDKAFQAYAQRRQRADAQTASAAAAEPNVGDADSYERHQGHYDISIRDFLNAARFYNFRREPFRGQQVLVLDFEPLPDFKPRNFGESVVQKVVGTIWIDDRAGQVARIQARSAKSIKLAGGLLASLDPGASIVAEQQKVNDEVWLPVYTEVHLSGHLLLLKNEKIDQIDQYSDYQKFTVGTKITVTGHPAPPAPPVPPAL